MTEEAKVTIYLPAPHTKKGVITKTVRASSVGGSLWSQFSKSAEGVRWFRDKEGALKKSESLRLERIEAGRKIVAKYEAIGPHFVGGNPA